MSTFSSFNLQFTVFCFLLIQDYNCYFFPSSCASTCWVDCYVLCSCLELTCLSFWCWWFWGLLWSCSADSFDADGFWALLWNFWSCHADCFDADYFELSFGAVVPMMGMPMFVNSLSQLLCWCFQCWWFGGWWFWTPLELTCWWYGRWWFCTFLWDCHVDGFDADSFELSFAPAVLGAVSFEISWCADSLEIDGFELFHLLDLILVLSLVTLSFYVSRWFSMPY